MIKGEKRRNTYKYKIEIRKRKLFQVLRKCTDPKDKTENEETLKRRNCSWPKTRRKMVLDSRKINK